MPDDKPSSEPRPHYRHYAFISYSRKDSKAAAWLQKRLEWFRFPVKLVPADRRPPHDRYVRPIYRDKTNLEVTDEHYWTNIRRALEESRYIIVLCSPHSASSEPVNMEVAHFLETHGHDASLVAPVIVSGNVTSIGADAALCPALCALGEILITRNLPTPTPPYRMPGRQASSPSSPTYFNSSATPSATTSSAVTRRHPFVKTFHRESQLRTRHFQEVI